MGETRARRKIREAVEAKGRTVEEITWEPIWGGYEMEGAGGGWTVFTNEGDHALGLNVAEVIEDIDWWDTPGHSGWENLFGVPYRVRWCRQCRARDKRVER